jgi:VIT1/CCC1 family predicted Fe2+/Mn2+ transporter
MTDTASNVATAPSLGTRIRRSFDASIGSIVFGMEDGTVSIFGLVFGVAASAPDSHAVLLAGATGAAAAAVSMMSGAFLDAKTANDQDAVKLAELRERLDRDSEAENMAARTRLLGEGYSDTDADTVLRLVGRHPESQLRITAAVTLGISDRTRQSPVAQAAWMFVADLIAASVPVIPFALFGLNTARLVSVVITLLLLVLLGVGRAVIGRRAVVATVLETIGIAAGAAVAGFVIGSLVT